MSVNHVSLFSGIGGLDLAAEWAGFNTVAFCEKDEFCQKVLAKHWPGVPIYDDVTTFDGRRFRGIGLLTGGFPCQDISQAGRQAGLSGERSGLWFEMLRIIGEARPAWVVAENVAALITMGIDTCLSGLEAEGYTTRTLVFPACAVGAVHQRQRCAIVAYRTMRGRDDSPTEEPGEYQEWQPSRPIGGRDSVIADADLIRSQGIEQPGIGQDLGKPGEQSSRSDSEAIRGTGIAGDSSSCGLHGIAWGGAGTKPPHRYTPIQSGDWRTWDIKPVLRRGDDGLSNRVDRLRALGNAVVPQQFYPLFKAIAEVSR